MNQNKDRIIIGVILLAIGFFGILFSITFFVRRDYFIWPMMEGWYKETLREVRGVVEKVKQMEIELDVDGEEVEVHGPPWFWQRIGIKEGDTVTVKGVFVSMMEQGKGWHEELIPFELRINGVTYGDASKGIPVWMQE
ncbi:MAG: hypothetical protein QXK15_00455 [Candidatus Bathyarchaeia archaeon]